MDFLNKAKDKAGEATEKINEGAAEIKKNDQVKPHVEKVKKGVFKC